MRQKSWHTGRYSSSITFRGKRICNKPFRDSRVEFTGSLKRMIEHKEHYLDRKAIKFFYVINRLGEEFIMGKFASKENKNDSIIVTLSYYEKLIFKFIPVI